MSPTILLKNGEPCLMLGGSGGPRIITSVLNVLLGVTDFGLTLEDAMLNLRPHHQWKPDQVFFDAEPSDIVRQALADRGHQIAARRRTGIVQAIIRTDNGWKGASDPRKGGRPAGY
jgi:gamma-glutamyltranspeptidase/glutathione hydrolase